MLHEILCHSRQTLRVAQNQVHFGDGLLAFLDLVFIGAFLGALLVIVLYFLQFPMIGEHLGGTAFIHNAPRDFVGHGFCHRVGIHHLTKHFNSGINRCARETHISRFWQGIVQIGGKAITALHPAFGHANILVDIGLRAVSLIGDANDVGAVGEQVDVLAELLYRGQEHAATLPVTEQFAQVLPRFHLFHALITDKPLGVHKLFGQLLVQIATVGD